MHLPALGACGYWAQALAPQPPRPRGKSDHIPSISTWYPNIRYIPGIYQQPNWIPSILPTLHQAFVFVWKCKSWFGQPVQARPPGHGPHMPKKLPNNNRGLPTCLLLGPAGAQNSPKLHLGPTVSCLSGHVRWNQAFIFVQTSDANHGPARPFRPHGPHMPKKMPSNNRGLPTCLLLRPAGAQNSPNLHPGPTVASNWPCAMKSSVYFFEDMQIMVRPALLGPMAPTCLSSSCSGLVDLNIMFRFQI